MRFWWVLRVRHAVTGRQLRSAAALAVLDPDSLHAGTKHAADVRGHLCRDNVLLIGKWAKVLRPVSDRLLGASGRYLPR